MATIDREALRSGDEEGAVEPLVEALAACGEADIRQFADALARRLYDLDGRAYADEAGESGGAPTGPSTRAATSWRGAVATTRR